MQGHLNLSTDSHTGLVWSAFLGNSKQEAALWLQGEDNLCLSCLTGRISVWSLPLTFFSKLWFPSEARRESLSSEGNVIQT